MVFVIFSVGLIIGLLLNLIINKISNSICGDKSKKLNLFVVLITVAVFLVCFLKFGLNIMFIKSTVLGSILVVVSFVDLRHRLIPDKIVIFTLITGTILLLIKDISIVNGILGMIIGGGLLLLLALIPNAMGGGDIKLMFALGLFLGYRRTLWALILSFILASLISVVLILFKIKGRKDHIPFGPFLSLGTFISLLFF